MVPIDPKLYRIFLVAGEQRFENRSALSREIAKRKYDEFSYVEEDERKYLTPKGVDDYVQFALQIGILNGDLDPYIRTNDVTRGGFIHALGEKVENFAEASGFSEKKIREAMRTLIERKPAQLPSPKSIHQLIAPSCSYYIFLKAINVQGFIDRTGLSVRSRQTFFVADILRE
mgnify:CR=1 FL=1